MPDLGVQAGVTSGQMDLDMDGSAPMIDEPVGLPELSREEFMQGLAGAHVPTISGVESVAPVKVDGVRQKIVEEALSYLGTDYVWGGASRSGVDCSGLVQQAFARFGVELPRVSFQQARVGRQIAREQAQPGDLVAWDNSSRNDGADHIAVYLGDGWIVEAPRPGEKVRKRRLSDGEDVWYVDMSGRV